VAESSIIAYIAAIIIIIAIAAAVFAIRIKRSRGCCPESESEEDIMPMYSDDVTVRELFEKNEILCYIDNENKTVYVDESKYDVVKKHLKVKKDENHIWSFDMSSLKGEYNVTPSHQIDSALLLAPGNPITFPNHDCKTRPAGSCIRLGRTNTSVKLLTSETMCIRIPQNLLCTAVRHAVIELILQFLYREIAPEWINLSK